ncbi:MAG: phytoene/squalene synthase family protein [Planctomycetes bacterium]|nr:phytoene/squalene synthase family protein [Planctomycetota bacterium]
MSAALQEAYAYCESVTRRSGSTFDLALSLVLRPRRQALQAIYAFCRMADDLVDLPGRAARDAAAAIERFREQLRDAFAGNPDGPLFVALLDAARRFQIPIGRFEEILDGVAMDLERGRYPTFEALVAYCRRVASSVGLACVHVFGFRDRAAPEAAVDLGIALQLTNILRDLREDAERGRIYLPAEDLQRFGVSERDILDGRRTARFAELMKFEVARAREYFDRGERLFRCLSRWIRPCPIAMACAYRKILDSIQACGYDVFTHRIRLTRGQRGLVLAATALHTVLAGRSYRLTPRPLP